MSLLDDRYWDFTAFKLRAPRPEYIEIQANWRERLPHHIGESAKLIKSALGSATTVLDVGAGNRYYADVFKNLGLKCRYLSVDTDSSAGMTPHDYSDFLAVHDTFDAIVMFELIEHLPLSIGIAFLEHARRLLNPNGVLIISTPNAHHPNHVWRIEVTHVRPWPAPDLYGALRLIGFDSVTLVRQYCLSPRRRLLRPLIKSLYRLMELDHSQTVFAICR